MTPSFAFHLSAMPTAISPIIRDAIISNAHHLWPNHRQRHGPPHKCQQYISSAALSSANKLSADQYLAMPIVVNTRRQWLIVHITIVCDAHRPHPYYLRPHRLQPCCQQYPISVFPSSVMSSASPAFRGRALAARDQATFGM